LVDDAYVLEQYELLRRKAMQGYGLHLFLDKGMAAWMEAVSCLSGRQEAPVELECSPPQLSSYPEVTSVLANMVLGCMREAHG
jgi:hypothetical protein